MKWPDRPKGFFEDWTVFCTEALAKLLKEQDDMLAAVLLAGGAVLGAGGIFALVQANQHRLAVERLFLELTQPAR